MSNILKQYRVAGEDKNVRVINSNSMIKQIFADSISHPADSYTGISSDAQSSLGITKSLSPDTQESGFNDGINASVVTEIDASAEKERLLEEAKLEADSILDKAKAEASRLLDEAKQRAQILYADNKSKGYEDGLAECQREFDEKEISLRQELSDKESSLKSKYDAYSKELESDLIDAIIQVFNKVFKIQFDDKKDILFHLVENTMSNIEVGKEFRIHVAYSNYKFMMSHLDEIQERIGNDIDIEVVNDANLDTSGCFIETSFGVFDCGIDMELNNLVIVEMASGLGYAIVDRMLGGRGDSLDKTREFSEIELLIIERILVICINLLQEPWQNVLDISPHLERIETNSQYAQIISPSEVIAIITMNIKIGDVEGLMNICLPYITLESVIDKLNTRYWYSNIQNHDETNYRNAIQSLIQKSQIPVKAVLGKSLISVKDFSTLVPGDVIRLDTNVDDELDIYVGNIKKFTALPGSSGDKYAVRITSVVREEQ